MCIQAKDLLQLTCFCFSVCILVSCDNLFPYVAMREARTGLNSLVGQLPDLAGFETTKVEYFDLADSAHGKTCYYARAFVIIGSSLPMEDALDTYVEKIQSLGWAFDGRQYTTARTLVRGKHDLLVVESGKVGSVLNAEEFTILHNRYRSIILIRLEYILPQRDGC